MINQIGIREFKNQVSKIVKIVNQDSVEYVITLRGEPIAIIRPVTDNDILRAKEAAIAQEIDDMLDIAEKVKASWQSQKTGVELLEEQRRY